MRGYLSRISGTALLAAMLAGCSGSSGIGFTPALAPDRALGNFNPGGNAAAQEIDSQIVPNSGVWRINLGGVALYQPGAGRAPMVASRVIYDSELDELWVTVNGQNIPLTSAGGATSHYVTAVCGNSGEPRCVDVEVDFFVNRRYAKAPKFEIDGGLPTGSHDGSSIGSVGFAHFGVRTAAGDMPSSGIATYDGNSRIAFTYTEPDGDIISTEDNGQLDITVDFGAAANQVDFRSFNGDLTSFGDHNLTGLATISGNSYSGALSGTITGTAFTPTPASTLNVTGTFSGTFYGPAADDPSGLSETAGVMEFSDNDSDGGTSAVGAGVGGFVANRTGFTP